MRYLTIALVVALALTAGCLNGVDEASETTDAFVEADFDSVEYTSQVVSEIGETGAPAQTSTSTTEATIDYRTSEFTATTRSSQESGGQVHRAQTLTEYLVDGILYDATLTEVRDGEEQNATELDWLKYDDEDTVEAAWTARDLLAVYSDVLEPADVELLEEDADAQVLDVDIDADGRANLLSARLEEDEDFFLQGVEFEEFEFRIWIAEDRLERAETTVSLSFEQQPDLEVDISFEDEFTAYDEDVEITLPEGTQDAEPVEVGDPVF